MNVMTKAVKDVAWASVFVLLAVWMFLLGTTALWFVTELFAGLA